MVDGIAQLAWGAKFADDFVHVVVVANGQDFQHTGQVLAHGHHWVQALRARPGWRRMSALSRRG